MSRMPRDGVVPNKHKGKEKNIRLRGAGVKKDFKAKTFADVYDQAFKELKKTGIKNPYFKLECDEAELTNKNTKDVFSRCGSDEVIVEIVLKEDPRPDGGGCLSGREAKGTGIFLRGEGVAIEFEFRSFADMHEKAFVELEKAGKKNPSFTLHYDKEELTNANTAFHISRCDCGEVMVGIVLKKEPNCLSGCLQPAALMALAHAAVPWCLHWMFADPANASSNSSLSDGG